MKGFVTFALALAGILLLFSFAQSAQTNEFELVKTENELMKAEEANKEKTLLENNTDRIIFTKLMEQLVKKNFNLKKAQDEINTALGEYYEGRVDATTIFHEKHGKADKEYLNKNSTTIILQLEKVTYGEYNFSSTTIKDTTVSAKLGNKIITYFELPVGHTTRILLPTIE